MKLRIISLKDFFMLLFILILMCGCALKPSMGFRASQSMLNKNPMKKMVVLSEGKVNYPSYTRKEFYFSRLSSIEATETCTKLVKDSLTNIGYDVVMAEPVGIGFQCQDWRVMPTENSEGDGKAIISDNQPQMIWPKFKNNKPFSRAAVKLLDDLEVSVQKGTFSDGLIINEFAPDKNSVDAITSTTGADTICLCRVYGERYSKRRQTVGAITDTMAFFLGGGVANNTYGNKTWVSCAFVSSKTAEVLFLNGGSPRITNMRLPDHGLQLKIRYLPNCGQPIDKEICREGSKAGYISCYY